MPEWEAGLWILFFASFLAATILPFSSEALLTGMLIADYNPLSCLILASAGNWLGGMSSYYLGRLGRWDWIERYLRIKKKTTIKWHNKVHGKESWIAFFCWLPAIGDIIALVLGLLKANVLNTSIGMLLGKVIRYAVVGYVTLIVRG